MYPDFTYNDIKDKAGLQQLVHEEATRIWENEKNRRGRTFEQLKLATLQGKVAEQWLVENCGFKWSNIKYHDLVNDLGDLVEVKAFSYGDIDTKFVQDSILKYKNASWNHSRWYMLFNCVNGIYTYKGTVKIK